MGLELHELEDNQKIWVCAFVVAISKERFNRHVFPSLYIFKDNKLYKVFANGTKSKNGYSSFDLHLLNMFDNEESAKEYYNMKINEVLTNLCVLKEKYIEYIIPAKGYGD